MDEFDFGEIILSWVLEFFLIRVLIVVRMME
jgi:hypothetical protein